MYDRIKIIREFLNLSQRDLEKLTSIDRNIWRNVEQGKQRVNQDHIEAIKKIAPQFIYWLVTGETLPNAGQISPPPTVEENKLEIVKMKQALTTNEHLR